MKGWLIYGKKEAALNKRYLAFYFEECERRGIDLRLVFVEELAFGVEKGNLYVRYDGMRVLNLPDFVISRAIYPFLTRHLEMMGIPVFNNAQVAEICNDKARTYQYVSQAGVPMIDTQFLRRGMVGNLMEHVSYPKVLKTVNGHGGNEVFLLDEEPSGEILKHFVLNDGVLQPVTGTRHEDLRVYVIGKEIIGGVLRKSREGFRANYSLGGEVSWYELSEEEKQLTGRIIDLFDFGLVGIDFIIGDEGELLFNEIEDVVGARMLYQCSDIHIVPLYLDYILERIGQK